MAVQLSGQWLVPNCPTFSGQFSQNRSKPKHLSSTTLSAAVSFSSPPPTIQIVGGKTLSFHVNENSSNLYESRAENTGLIWIWIFITGLRHCGLFRWFSRKRILGLNSKDMISTADRNAWAAYFARQGTKFVFSNGQLGMGTLKLGQLAKALAAGVNVKRRAKGLLSRLQGSSWYSWVSKCREIFFDQLFVEATDMPSSSKTRGYKRSEISDQSAAVKLAICDDIGERSYDFADVAAILVQMLTKIPSVDIEALQKRYKIDVDGHNGKIFIHKLTLQLFNGDDNQAAFRVLTDFRKGKLH